MLELGSVVLTCNGKTLTRWKVLFRGVFGKCMTLCGVDESTQNDILDKMLILSVGSKNTVVTTPMGSKMQSKTKSQGSAGGGGGTKQSKKRQSNTNTHNTAETIETTVDTTNDNKETIKEEIQLQNYVSSNQMSEEETFDNNNNSNKTQETKQLQSVQKVVSTSDLELVASEP